MSYVAAKWAFRGLGATGVCGTALAACFPDVHPLATALGLSVAAACMLGLSRRAPRHPLDRPVSPGSRPGPDDGSILLGTSSGGEAWLSTARLAGGLCVTGPVAARRAMLAGISRQAAEAGIGHAVLSCSTNDGLVERVLADGAGSPWSFTVLDAEAATASATHSFTPLAGLTPRAVVRLLLGANPQLRGDNATAIRSRLLLQTVVPILCFLEREGLMGTLSVCILMEHLELKRTIMLADVDAYPQFDAGLRRSVSVYLAALPGYQEEKKFKQSAAVLELHAMAVSLIGDGLAWASGIGAPHFVSDVPDALASDLCNPGMRTVIRAGSGPGEGHALRLMVGSLLESLRARQSGGVGSMPFLVVVDGLDAFPDDVADSIRAMVDLGAALVCGVGNVRSAPGGRIEGDSALTLALSAVDDALPATLTTVGGSLAVAPVPVPSKGKPRPIRRRIPLVQPQPEDLENAARLVVTLGRLIEPDGEEVAGRRFEEAWGAVAGRASAGDPISVIAEYLREPHDGDAKVDACAALYLAHAGVGPESLDPLGVRERIAARRPPLPMAPSPGMGDFMLDFDDVLESPPEPKVEAPPRPSGGVAVVVPASVARDTVLGETQWKGLAGKELPLAALQDHAEARATLTGEFPHLGDIIGRIVNDASRGGHIRLRPMLFNGPAGSGKSRFARRLGEVLGLRTLSYNCGGASDSSFGGTSRQWTSARASVVLQHIARTRMANPAIMLDEVEKVGTGRQNGNFADLLLGLTERETACRSFDLYLETEVDLSHVTWLATANTIDDLHPAFRDRFKAIHVPCPGIEHAEALVPAIVRIVNEERGLQDEWAFVASEAETAMIAELWGGGSVRKLRRVVERVIDAVDDMDRRLMH